MDLVILVADKNAEFALRGLLDRTPALGIRPVSYQVFVHPEADPGVLLSGHDFLRGHANRCAHGLVVFDREGCGRERKTRDDIEREVEMRLSQSGWDDRAAAIVIAPELEAWVWSDSPRVDAALAWKGRTPALRTWLIEEGFLTRGLMKPSRPKEAMEAALRIVQRPRSSAIYERLGRSVSVRRCADPAFGKLTCILQAWFPR